MRKDVVRFSDLAAAIPGLSDRMLSERLKELEAEGVIERRVIPETPVRVEYRLTARGEALGSVLDAVLDWAHAWLALPEGKSTGAARAVDRQDRARVVAPRRSVRGQAQGSGGTI
jgi:DNA-binding HxlR family transcriptional regulator